MADLYKAALYLRVSKDDQEKGESNSIASQRDIILKYLENIPEISVCSIQCDDGYSGLNFQRPAFMKMMADIENGRINCIAVKDLSRFGRNYIEAGRFIQVLFPKLGVRFISVNDHYDSLENDSYTSDILVAFKNIINDAYSRDISKKIKTQLDIKRIKGDFIGSFAPFGYMKSPYNPNKLVIDPIAAAVVKEIFRLKLGGLGNAKIAALFNEFSIPSPYEYKLAAGYDYYTPFKKAEKTGWSAASVGRILGNAVYMGTLEQGKKTVENIRTRKSRPAPKENWIRATYMHEPIIEEQCFHIVQKLLGADMRSNAKGYLPAYAGLVFCEGCGETMVRKIVCSKGRKYCYYICSTNKKDKSKCSPHRIGEKEIRAAVAEVLYATGLKSGEKHVPDMDFQELFKKQEKHFQNAIEGLQRDFHQGLINKSQYQHIYHNYLNKLEETKEARFKSSGYAGGIRDTLGADFDYRMLLVTNIDSIIIGRDKKIKIKGIQAGYGEKITKKDQHHPEYL